jgi:hypothetical protein
MNSQPKGVSIMLIADMHELHREIDLLFRWCQFLVASSFVFFASSCGSDIRVDAMTASQHPQPLLTMLNRSTDRRCRCGAPVKYLSHSASFHSRESMHHQMTGLNTWQLATGLASCACEPLLLWRRLRRRPSDDGGGSSFTIVVRCLRVGYGVIGWRGCAAGHELVVVPAGDVRRCAQIA